MSDKTSIIPILLIDKLDIVTLSRLLVIDKYTNKNVKVKQKAEIEKLLENVVKFIENQKENIKARKAEMEYIPIDAMYAMNVLLSHKSILKANLEDMKTRDVLMYILMDTSTFKDNRKLDAEIYDEYLGYVFHPYFKNKELVLYAMNMFCMHAWQRRTYQKCIDLIKKYIPKVLEYIKRDKTGMVRNILTDVTHLYRIYETRHYNEKETIQTLNKYVLCLDKICN